MTEEQNLPEEPKVEEEQVQSDELVDELQALGSSLVAAVKSLWDSEESRSLRKEIGDGFLEVGRQVDSAIKSAQESEAAKEFKVQVKETMDKARESDVSGQVQETLVSGLRQLNAELNKFVASIEPTDTAGEAPEDEAEA
jgi:hypothetical protein